MSKNHYEVNDTCYFVTNKNLGYFHIILQLIEIFHTTLLFFISALFFLL